MLKNSLKVLKRKIKTKILKKKIILINIFNVKRFIRKHKKKLREMTGVGFKDCKSALDETNGNIEKSVEFLRKKGIAKLQKNE